jgi:hypothetical protein
MSDPGTVETSRVAKAIIRNRMAPPHGRLSLPAEGRGRNGKVACHRGATTSAAHAAGYVTVIRKAVQRERGGADAWRVSGVTTPLPVFFPVNGAKNMVAHFGQLLGPSRLTSNSARSNLSTAGTLWGKG